jgi:hypothetical protein
MASGEIEQPTGIQWGVAVLCFLFALFFLTQLLGLFFIERIAERAAVPDNDVRIPLSVRFVGLVAKELHEDNLTARLKPDGSNWPFAFRMFFALEMCGLAGLCLAVTQLGASALKHRHDWMAQAVSILIGSCLALVMGVLFLRLIR